MADRQLKDTRVRAIASATARNELSQEPDKAEALQESDFDSGDLTTGIGSQQADRVWKTLLTIADGATTQVDLFDFAGLDVGGGVGNDALGQVMALAQIVSIQILNLGPGRLEINDGIANGFAELPVLSSTKASKPGGWTQRAEPERPAMIVTDASKHLLDLTAETGRGDCRVELHIIGRSG